MNQAHNLPIDELIQTLQMMKINGARYVDFTIHSPFDIGIKESEYTEEEPKIISLSGIDLTKLI
jgi:hypothetical protein